MDPQILNHRRPIIESFREPYKTRNNPVKMRRIGPRKPPSSPAPPPLSGTSAEVNRRQLTLAAGGATTRWAAGASDARAAEATFRQIAGGRIQRNSPL
ncbi:MAG: hypothetical protein ACK56F_04855 [bacterium]